MMTTDEALTSVNKFRSQLNRKIKIMNVTASCNPLKIVDLFVKVLQYPTQ